MALIVEYYERKTTDGYEYYYMPVDNDAKNKENIDSRCHRIWKFNTRNNRVVEIYNIREGKPQIDPAEFFKIQLMAKPVPYSDYYLMTQRMKPYIDEYKAKESPTAD